MSGGAFDYKDNELNYLQGMVAKEIGYIEYCANDSDYGYIILLMHASSPILVVSFLFACQAILFREQSTHLRYRVGYIR